METHDVASIGFEYKFGRYNATRSILVPINRALMTVIGYYLSEGNIVSVKRRENAVVRFCFGKNLNEFRFANECSEALDELGFHHRVRLTRDGLRITCDRVALARFLVTFFGKGARSKSIPLWVKTLPSALLSRMFECYLNGDGHRVNRYLSEAKTVSEQLAFAVREIALKLGYTVSIYEPPAPSTGTIQGRKVRLHQKYTVKFNNSPNSNKTRNDDRFLYLRIRSIRSKRYRGPLLDLKVEDDNSFCTKAFAVHNCGHLWSEMHEVQHKLEPTGKRPK